MNCSLRELISVTFILASSVLASTEMTFADDGARARAFEHLDSHDRNYPPRGHVVRELPRDAYASRWHGSTYYFHSGVWYRPARSQWIVVAPPIGLVVPLLPPFYSTIWINGAPYYYANDVYYAWRPALRGYAVVEPPAKQDSVRTESPPADLFVYPKNGQSAEQQATDRYECHRWAVGQTGFDPTEPSVGTAGGALADKRAAYYRAMSVCLEGRGYSVK